MNDNARESEIVEVNKVCFLFSIAISVGNKIDSYSGSVDLFHLSTTILLSNLAAALLSKGQKQQ
jgi:hypothetical protein